MTLGELRQHINTQIMHDAEIVQPSELTLSMALLWLSQIWGEALFSKHPWKNPLVNADYDGDVVFEWWVKDRKMTVYVNGYNIECLQISGEQSDVIINDVSVYKSAEMRQAWDWLFGTDPH